MNIESCETSIFDCIHCIACGPTQSMTPLLLIRKYVAWFNSQSERCNDRYIQWRKWDWYRIKGFIVLGSRIDGDFGIGRDGSVALKGVRLCGRTATHTHRMSAVALHITTSHFALAGRWLPGASLGQVSAMLRGRLMQLVVNFVSPELACRKFTRLGYH